MAEQMETIATPHSHATERPGDAFMSAAAQAQRAAHLSRTGRPNAQGWWSGTGRRKTAVARVRIKPGSGKFMIRKTGTKQVEVNTYFCEERDRNDAVAPLKITNTLGKMDVVVRVDGGGFMGQAGAVKLGLARALKNYDSSLERALRDAGYLTRDAREVERKKYGQAGARRRFQFSKR